MRFVIDLQSCQSGSRFGGIGRYSLELAKEMVRLSPQYEHIILLNDRNPEAEARVRREFRDLLGPNSFKIFSIPKGSGYLSDEGRTTKAADQIRDQFIRDLAPDILHVSSLIEGIADDVATSIAPDWPFLTAVTLYDLIPLRQADAYLRDVRARTHYMAKVDQLRYADVILAISDFSAKEGLEFIPGFDGVMADIRGGIDPMFQRIPDAKARVGGVLAAKGIGDRFLLYTASFDQRKNQKGLIEAFALLPPDVRHGRQIVIVGNGWPSAYEELTALAVSKGLSANDVIFAGHVSDDELLGLYNLCELFVFPSLWEGLGMPVLEAMACGAPVVGSNTTSVPEVLGMEEASFDPFDAVEISKKIKKALTDPKFSARLKAHALSHSATFTWANSAARALAAIEEGLDRRSTASKPPPPPQDYFFEEDLIDKSSLCLARNEIELGLLAPASDSYKIGWLTSWGNRCGIASYSKSLLENFQSDVIVFGQNLNAGEEIWRTDHELIRCRDHNKEADLSDLQAAIVNAGITDVFIQFNYSFFNFDNFNAFVSDMVRSGRRVYVTLHSTSDPQDVYGHRLQDVRRGLLQCNRIFVHNDIDIARLSALGVTRNVLQVPLGIPTIPGERRVNADRPCPLVAAYGFFLPHKGLKELVEAIALLRHDGQKVNLRLVNADYGDPEGVSAGLIEETKATAKQLGIEDMVEFRTEYLSDSESVDLLREADLLVFPYQKTGESASAAVHMGLATKVPIAVTPLTIFDNVAYSTFRLPGVTPWDMCRGIRDVLRQLSENDSDANHIAVAASTLRTHNSYAAVAAYMQAEIRKEIACSHWSKYFEAVPTALPTIIGRMTKRGLSSGGEGGVLAYGPYMSMEAGLHRLVIRGQATPNTHGACGVVEIKGEFGQMTIDNFVISAANGTILDQYFRIPRDLENVEILIVTNTDAAIEIFGYELMMRSK